MKYLTITILCLTLLSCSTPKTNLSHEQIQNLEEAKPDKILNPRYPRQAAIHKLEGFVKFVFDIAPDGSVKNLRKIESVPSGVFDDVATYSISKWLFKPAKLEGKTVWQKNMTYTLEFKMGE